MSYFSSKKLIIFDLDGTLAPSKSAMEPEMSEILARLIEVKKVAVISGGGYGQFQIQFLNSLPQNLKQYNNLYLLPATGTRLYSWHGSWVQQYAEDLTPSEKEKIFDAFKYALRAARFETPAKLYGELIEDRGSQVTFSAHGQKAPLELKSSWDPDQKKREYILKFLKPRLPEFEVRLGGTSSIDITRRGITKAYGIRRLENYLNITPDEIIFVGDALYPSGNDYPARATGADCIQVANPKETEELIRGWLDLTQNNGVMQDRNPQNRKEVMAK